MDSTRLIQDRDLWRGFRIMLKILLLVLQPLAFQEGLYYTELVSWLAN
jgi:hypothetical protein